MIHPQKNLIMRELLKKYNIRAPRYTSYPPANRFTEEFAREDAIRLIDQSNQEKPSNISLYFHFPYCPQTCYFCGCNSWLQKDDQQSDIYMAGLLKEVSFVLDRLNPERELTQIHWGGGTPNSMDYRLLERVMTTVLKRVRVSEKAEIAIECNPAYLTLEQISDLRRMGFNRLSLGIQDFDQKVLDAVNRKASLLPVESLMEQIRKENYKGVNFDFIYGLPLQTPHSFLSALDRALAMQPDRLVTFSYAHVPWVKAEQKRLESYWIPEAEQKLDMLIGGMEKMTAHGYRMIGMDHYAHPDDDLAKASLIGQLHRNFQGYCTRETTGQVYAFGASSISQLTHAYVQNIRHPEKYLEQISSEGYAGQRGYVLSEKEMVIREAITEIMCNGYLNFAELGKRFRSDAELMRRILKYDAGRFADLEADRLLNATNDELILTLPGKLMSRVVAMRLDPLIGEETTGFSRTI